MSKKNKGKVLSGVRQSVLLITKPTIKRREHRSIVRQLRALGYGVAEGRMTDSAAVGDIFLERLPQIED